MARIDSTGVDIRRLRYFVAVCDHGGFSRAAGAVGIAQPALTRQMQILEQELGVELFTRNGRNAVPSAAGQALLSGARGHLDNLDALIARLRHDFAAAPQDVTMGICPTIAPLFLDHLSDMPGLQVIEAYSGDLRSLMQAGRLGLALTYAADDTPGTHATPLLTERLVLAARTALPDAPTLHDLTGLRLILPSRVHQLRRIVDARCAALGITLPPVLELDSLAAVKAMVADDSGGYATILPHHAVAQESGLTLRALADPAMVRTIALVQPDPPRTPLPAALTARIAARAEEIARSLPAVALPGHNPPG